MKSIRKIFFSCAILLSLNATLAQANNASQLWGDCTKKPAALGDEVTIEGVKINLKGQGVTLYNVGKDVYFKKGEKSFLLGELENAFDVSTVCKPGGSLSAFAERFHLVGQISVDRKENVSICKPALKGLFYTGFTVDWYRTGTATLVFDFDGELVSVKGTLEEWYRDLDTCYARMTY